MSGQKACRLLVISAHSDDAALSVSGLLDRIAIFYDTMLLTLTGGASTNHQIWRERLDEDRQFARYLGAQHEQCELQDARLVDPNAVVIGAPSAARIDEFSVALQNQYERFRPTLILSPMGIGGHSDHLAAFAASMELSKHLLDECCLCFYEDQPYVTDDAMLLTNRLEFLCRSGLILEPRIVTITHQQANREHAVAFYPSQRLTRFQSKIMNYLSGIGTNESPAERIWELVRTEGSRLPKLFELSTKPTGSQT